MSEVHENNTNQQDPNSSSFVDQNKVHQSLDKQLYKLQKENSILQFKIETLNQKLSDIVHNKYLEEIKQSKVQAKYVVTEEVKDDKSQWRIHLMNKQIEENQKIIDQYQADLQTLECQTIQNRNKDEYKIIQQIDQIQNEIREIEKQNKVL